jgi:hypothetical protein
MRLILHAGFAYQVFVAAGLIGIIARRMLGANPFVNIRKQQGAGSFLRSAVAS